MNEQEGSPFLPANRQETAIHPLDVFYAGLGYIGVLYESQLVYFKDALEKTEACDRDRQLVDGLQAAHILGVNLFSSLLAWTPPDEATLQNLLQANAVAVKQLALEGKNFVEQVRALRGDG